MGNKIHSLKAIPPNPNNKQNNLVEPLQRLYKFATNKNLKEGTSLQDLQAYTATTIEIVADELDIKLERGD